MENNLPFQRVVAARSSVLRCVNLTEVRFKSEISPTVPRRIRSAPEILLRELEIIPAEWIRRAEEFCAPNEKNKTPVGK